ncbi:MAG: hypothetical protein PVI00_17550 [Desulfobacterales bacterium]|jgi:hypothetical protein
MKSLALSLFKKYPILKKLYLNYINFGYNSSNRLPWKRLGNSHNGLKDLYPDSENKPKILMATCAGSLLTALDIETILSVALSLRGAEIKALICDGFLPACLMCQSNTTLSIRQFAHKGPSPLYCKRCFESGIDAYRSAGIKIHLFSDYITEAELTDAQMRVDKTPFEMIENYCHQDLAVGEHAMAGALRFFAMSSIDTEPYARPVLKRYFKASILTAIVLQKIQKEQHFEGAVFHHGIYVPHGIIGEVFRKEGVRVVNWNVGYRKGTFIFSHNDTYHHTMMNEPVSKWESIVWNAQIEQKVLSYIKNRSQGTRDWHVFLNEPSGDITALGIDTAQPAIGLLTNVCWDAQLHYPANVFKNMLEWIFKTIEYFAKRSDLQLIIRVHPAEVTAEIPSRQLVVEEISKSFPALPSNIFIISPQSKLNTYAIMEACDAVIIYGTKTGVELTSFGIPVIVAGEAWIRNKGITIDPEIEKQYYDVLDGLPFGSKMNAELTQRARKYAYHFFFKRMIPIEVIEPSDSSYSIKPNINHLSDLMPNKNIGLDTICNGILSEEDFIYEG